MLSKLLFVFATVPVFGSIIPRQTDGGNSTTGGGGGNSTTGGGGGNSTTGGDNSTTPSNEWPHLPVDLSIFNGTWYGVGIEKDIYQDMQRMEKKYNVSCDCATLNLEQLSPVTLSANYTCDAQFQNSTFPIVSEGILTWLPFPQANKNKNNTDDDQGNQGDGQGNQGDGSRRIPILNYSWGPNKYFFAFLFSRPYVQSDETTITKNNTMPDIPGLSNMHNNSSSNNNSSSMKEHFYRGFASGDKGFIYWSFYSSSQNETLNDVAFAQSIDMTSADGTEDMDNVKVLISKNETLYDNSTYNDVTSRIPELGKNANSTFTQLPNTCSGGSGSGSGSGGGSGGGSGDNSTQPTQ
ncbi:unnamed protein product [Cunninghamella blakesleeana]